MSDGTTTNKDFEKPAKGRWARSELGEWMRSNLDDLDSILGRFERTDHGTVADTNTVNVSGDSYPQGMLTVIDQTNNHSGTFLLDGDGAVVPIDESGREQRLEATTTQDVGSISAQSTATFTVSVSGAETGDPVAMSPPSGLNTSLSVTGFVTSADTVTVVVLNATSGSIDPASGDYTVKVFDMSETFGYSQGSGANLNVFDDGSAYVVENQTGGDADLETVLIRAV